MYIFDDINSLKLSYLIIFSRETMPKTFQDLAASISSPRTVTVYKYALEKYMPYRKVSNIDELLNADRDIKLIQ
jgi:hypothetical protein